MCVLIALGAAFLACGAAFSIVTKDVRLDESKLSLSNDEIILYDKDDDAVKTLSLGDKKRAFPLAEIPDHVKNAFIDTEDRRFYKHGGIDLKGMARATKNNLIARSFKEGASTISQQLVKNTHLTQEKTIRRKLKELKLTLALEKRYTKDEILEKYLDSIYFGHNCFGIKSAAEFYFSKTPDELTLGEGACLAGLVKSPNNYSPFKNPEKCKARRNVVLSAMFRARHIDENEKEAAQNEPLPLQSTKQSNTDGSYFVAVYDELEKIADEYSLLLNGKIKIYTYLDSDLQNTLYSLLSDVAKTSALKKTTAGNNAPADAQKATNATNAKETSDTTAAVINNDSCGVSAYFSTCGEIRRSPASLIKPLCVYAPAFEEGLLSPATPVLDEPTDFGGYAPKNYGNKYYGYVSAREAIAKSLNVPAVKTLNALTLEKSRFYLEKLGLTANESDFSLAAALGGVKNGYTLTQLTAAYSSFARGGIYCPAAFIRKIAIGNDVVYSGEQERKKAETEAFSESTAALITDVLQTCAKDGTAKKLRSLPFEIAAKTGTHGDENGNIDAYALGYTATNTAAIWLGNADNTKIGATGGGVPCDKLYRLFLEIGKKQAIGNFSPCDDVEKIALDKTDYEKEHKLTIADELSPENYKIYEIFSRRNLPLERSTRFSRPKIGVPAIAFENGKVSITFAESPPDGYEYLVEREENGKKCVVYRGKPTEIFIDEVEKGKSYEYSVTPLYKDRIGETIVLPAVTAKGDELSPADPAEPPDIVDEDWWNY